MMEDVSVRAWRHPRTGTMLESMLGEEHILEGLNIGPEVYILAFHGSNLAWEGCPSPAQPEYYAGLSPAGI
jgi:hypothetical protein